MMPDPLLHAQTIALIERLSAHPPQAMLLIAPEGAGKRTVAELLAARLLRTEPGRLESHPQFRLVAPEPKKTSIPIEAVRDLQQFTKLKVAGDDCGVQRIALIEQAHGLTIEAQNAALKLLEEPPAGMVLLLTASNEQALLPTIRSRLQSIRLQLPARQAVVDHFTALGNEAVAVERASLVSGGLPGLTHAIVYDTGHPLMDTVDTARTLLRADALERLAQADALGKSREDCLRLTGVLQRMAQAAIAATASRATEAQPKALRQWHRILQAANQAERYLRHNAQPKLVMANLMLSL